MDDGQFKEWVVEHLSRVADDVTELRVTVAAQHITLEEHQRRSTANEEAVAAIRAELKPVALHVSLVGAAAKVALGLASLSAAALGVLRALGVV